MMASGPSSSGEDDIVQMLPGMGQCNGESNMRKRNVYQ